MNVPDPVLVERALCRRLAEHDAARPRGDGATQAELTAWEVDRRAIIAAIHGNTRSVAFSLSPLERMRAGIAHFEVHK